MQRCTDTYREQDKFGTGKDGYTEGDPGQVGRTVLRADDLNAIQEEIARPIEATGITLEPSNYDQFTRALQIREMLSVLGSHWYESALPAGVTGGVYAVACEDSFDNDVASAGPRLMIAVGDDTCLYNLDWGRPVAGSSQWSDAEGGTADYRGAAGKDGACVAVGLAGAWRRVTTTGSTAAGTISGTPGLSHVFWDAVNSLWWACGAGGVYKAADAGTLTWTQISSTGHSAGCVLPSGRVLFYRDSNDTVYWSDNLVALSSGATLGSTSGAVYMVSDANAGLVLVRGRQLFISADGTASSGGNFTGASTILRACKWRGEVVLLAYNASANDINTALIPKLAPSTTLADWIGTHTMNALGLIAIAFCDTFAVAADEVYHTGDDTVLISPALPRPY